MGVARTALSHLSNYTMGRVSDLVKDILEFSLDRRFLSERLFEMALLCGTWALRTPSGGFEAQRDRSMERANFFGREGACWGRMVGLNVPAIGLRAHETSRGPQMDGKLSESAGDGCGRPKPVRGLGCSRAAGSRTRREAS